MEATYQMLLYCISVIQSDPWTPHIKIIKVTTDFYNYLEATHGKNVFLREYNGNIVSYIMGIPVVVDDMIEDECYVVQFEEEKDMFKNKYLIQLQYVQGQIKKCKASIVKLKPPAPPPIPPSKAA